VTTPAYPVVGGPWDGRTYASVTDNRFTVHELNGAVVAIHRYVLVNLPPAKPFWRYAGKPT